MLELIVGTFILVASCAAPIFFWSSRGVALEQPSAREWRLTIPDMVRRGRAVMSTSIALPDIKESTVLQ